MEQTIFEIIGWVGLVFCIAAFFVSDVMMLRLITLLGCSMMFSYYLYEEVAQGIISNLAVLVINAGYVIKTMHAKNKPAEAPMEEVLIDEVLEEQVA